MQRNFHIFYQLLEVAHLWKPEWVEKYKLRRPYEYSYLNPFAAPDDEVYVAEEDSQMKHGHVCVDKAAEVYKGMQCMLLDHAGQVIASTPFASTTELIDVRVGGAIRSVLQAFVRGVGTRAQRHAGQ